MKSDFDNHFCLWLLSKIKGLGPATIKNLLGKYPNPIDIITVAQKNTAPNRILNLIKEYTNNKDFYRQTKNSWNEITDQRVSFLDEDYPLWLKNIYDPPLFLFYRGNKTLLTSTHLLTIVGSRSITAYHQSSLTQLIKDLKNTPLIIVSGLAIGIDALAHQKALENNLPTIAVLGSGLDDNVLYPASNLYLAHKILEHNGLIISEYPGKTQAQKHYFPQRNRILAGLAKSTVIISGALKSGTLITAQVAIDEGREVFALPGNINLNLSQGPNNLIQRGANILLTADDIINHYKLKHNNKTSKKILFDNKLQAKIYHLLQVEALSLTDLVNQTKISATEIKINLSAMEISGLITINQLNKIEII